MYFAVVLALETAMRRSELLGLTKRDIAPDGRTATLRLTKNGDKRVVPLSTRARDMILTLLSGDHEHLLPMTPMALRKSFERAANAIGAHDLHFHDLRHTATTRLAKKLPNLIELAAVTGHKDVRMLARYYHPDPKELADRIG